MRAGQHHRAKLSMADVRAMRTAHKAGKRGAGYESPGQAIRMWRLDRARHLHLPYAAG